MNPYTIIGAILLAISLAGGGFYQGWERRGDHEAAVQLKATLAATAKLNAERERADGLAGALALEKQNIKTVTIEKIKEVPVVTTVYKENPDAPAKPIPEHIYTAGFVRVWDGAYGAISQLPAGAGRPADPPGDADLVRTRLTAAEVLANHVENAGKHASCYAQLNKLIDFELGRARQ